MIQNGDTLQSVLRSLKTEASNSQLLDLLDDLVFAGALEAGDGPDIAYGPFWRATGDGGLAERIMDLIEDLDAVIAELFMDGKIGFTVRDHPRIHLWWEACTPHDVRTQKPN